MEFQCDCCGLCCRSLKGAALYKDLDDGTGTCRYFDRNTNLCTIYQNRPEKCNVRAMYRYFADKMTYEEWLEANAKVCRQLKAEHGR